MLKGSTRGIKGEPVQVGGLFSKQASILPGDDSDGEAVLVMEGQVEEDWSTEDSPPAAGGGRTVHVVAATPRDYTGRTERSDNEGASAAIYEAEIHAARKREAAEGAQPSENQAPQPPNAGPRPVGAVAVKSRGYYDWRGKVAQPEEHASAKGFEPRPPDSKVWGGAARAPCVRSICGRNRWRRRSPRGHARARARAAAALYYLILTHTDPCCFLRAR